MPVFPFQDLLLSSGLQCFRRTSSAECCLQPHLNPGNQAVKLDVAEALCHGATSALAQFHWSQALGPTTVTYSCAPEHNYMCSLGNEGRPQHYLSMCTPTKPAAANSRPAPAMGAPVNPCRCSTGTEVIKVLATYIHQSCKASGQGWFQPSFWNQAVLGISSDFISASARGQLQSLHAPRACGGRAAPTVRSLENEAARTGPRPSLCLHNRTSIEDSGFDLCTLPVAAQTTL